MATADQASLAPRAGWLRDGMGGAREAGGGFLAAMTLVGTVVRLAGLTSQSLWVDEILTWQAIRPGGDLHFWEQVRDTIQGPLHLAVVWPLLHIQDSALMVRLPAVVAGILAVPVFGVLAFRLLNGRAARVAVLLFTLNPLLIWYSQEGRGYSFLVLFTLVAALYYLEMLHRGPRLALLGGFVLASAAMVLSNLSGTFQLAAMVLTLVAWHRPRGRGDRVKWVLGFGLVGLLIAPWLLRASGIWAVDRIVPGAGTGAALRGASTFSPLAVPYAVYSYFFGYSLGPSLRELHQPDRMAVLMGYLPVLILGAIAAGAALLAGVTRLDRRRLTLLAWIGVPLALAAVLAMRNIKPWNPRYTLVVLPWLLLLAGLGLDRLPRRRGALAAAVLLGLTLVSLGGYFGDSRYAKADVRSAAAWADTVASAGSTILVPVVTGVFRYYDRGAHELLDSYGTAPLRGPGEAEAYLQRTLAGKEACLVVLAREWYFDPEGYLLPALARTGRLEPRGVWPGVEAFSWRRTSRPAVKPDPGRRDDL